MNKIQKIFSSILLLLILAACDSGGGAGESSEPAAVFESVDTNFAKTIGGGKWIDCGSFSFSKKIYSIVSYISGNKPESNSSPNVTSSWKLDTSYSLMNSINSSRNEFLPNQEQMVKNAIYKSGQSDFDSFLRERENSILANRDRLVDKRMNIMRSAAPSTITVGTSWNGVKVYDSHDYLNTINTKCRYISTHAYFFVDTTVSDTDVTDTELAAYATAFELIYTMNHNKFGSENDVDGNGKLIIVFSDEISNGMLGYFYAADKFSSTLYSDSNEGDIFYITADDYSVETICGTLAHEFQHMIYFDEHYNRGVTFTYTWLNEALSQAAEYYNNYVENHEEWIEAFLGTFEYEGVNYPGWTGLSLTHWTSANYGYGAVFIRYVIDQYGDDVIKNMCASEKVGIAAVEDATGEDFNTIFYNFMLALAMSGQSETSGALYDNYNFSNLDLQTIQPVGRTGLSQWTTFTADAGYYVYNNSMKPYEIFFVKHTGTFRSISLSGRNVSGAVMAISK